MQIIRGVRVENMFWMLAYASGEFEPTRTVAASLDRTDAPLTPFATSLLTGAERLVRQGFYQSYVRDRRQIPTLRGRLLPLPTIRDGGHRLGKVWCEFDRISIDILPNQIIRSALRRIGQTKELDHDLRKRARTLDRRFDGIKILDVVPRDFSIVGSSREHRGYRFLLSLAKFILTDLRPIGLNGNGQFIDVDVQSVIHNIFERFVRNFLRQHQERFHVQRTRRTWSDAHPQNPQANRLLPSLETDVVLTEPRRTIVIDTKFYAKTLREHHGVERAREAHLYQLLGYLHNMQRSGRFGGHLEGVLLYPLAQSMIDARWIIHGFPIRLCTLDLSQPWHTVSDKLLAIAIEGGASRAGSAEKHGEETTAIVH